MTLARPAPVRKFVNQNFYPRQIGSKSTYVVVEWNINGWFSKRNPYNLDFKQNIIDFLDSDFLILPETHCSADQKLEMQNYTFYQNNRKKLGNNLGRGSGGIAIGVKNQLLNYHEILGIYGNSIDGLIGLKLRNTSNDFCVGIVGMYLSPNNYRYGQDAEGFFNNAAVMWQDFFRL